MKPTGSQVINQCAGLVGFALVAWALLVPVVNIAARSPRMKDRPVIRVGIYNYARIGRTLLRSAEEQTAAVFGMAGVGIVWLECLRNPARFMSDDSTPDFSVRILRGSAVSQGRQDAGIDVMGESIIPAGVDGPVAGGIANIFDNRVKEVSSESGLFTGAVLGEAIAHELGHMMLGPQHTRRGAMKILWTHQDQVLISHCELRFLPGQAKDLRHAARSLQQDSLPMVLARR